MNKKEIKNKQKLSRSLLQEEIGSTYILKIIILFLSVIVLFFLYWSASVELNEVVTAKGKIESLENISDVQHAVGGKISEIYVDERDLVSKGQPLLELDASILEFQIQEVEMDLYYLRKQRDLLQEELTILEKLYNDKLTSVSEFLKLQREVADIKGRINIGQKKMERYKYLISDSVIYAPTEGRVHGLLNLGSGSVIKAGETIFSIIPDDIRYIAKVEIPAAKMASIEPGLPVVLKFTAYDFSRYGGMEAVLDEISPTTFLDNSNRPYYQGIINLPKNYLDGQAMKHPILQGMTLSSDIRTGSKTLLQYLFLPVKASQNNSFKEP